jgi:hypothetical protein
VPDVIVSAFDSDTVVYPDYFACLTWHVCTSTDPLRSSFQPVPLYNNNIWHVPMPARVTAPESNRNEEDLASREFTCNIFPNSAKELFHKLVSA